MTATPDDARAWEMAIRALAPVAHCDIDGSAYVQMADAVAVFAAALTEARIQGARDALKPAPHLDELTALSQEMGLYDAAALSEARDQGAREATERCIHALPGSIPSDGYHSDRREGWNDAISESVDALSAMLTATPSPAIAPLREAVVADPHAAGWLLKDVRKASDRAAELGLPVNRFTGRPCDHSYVRNTSGAISDWVCDLCGNKLDDLAKAAQGAVTEERTP